MLIHYDKAEKLYKDLHAQDINDPEKLDQQLWMQEKAAARAAFIMGIAAIEAFTNNVLTDHAIRSKEDIPKNLLFHSAQKGQKLEKWRLIDKVYFAPLLCNEILSPPACYFDRQSAAFRTFAELVEIRNSIMHGNSFPFLVLIDLTDATNKVIMDDFQLNFWPLSRIPHDFSSFNFKCAETACKYIAWVRDSLVKFIDRVDQKYMTHEQIKLISPIIADQTATKDELLKNWKSYIQDDSFRYHQSESV